MKKWRYFALIPLLAAAACHVRLFGSIGHFVDAGGTGVVIVFGSARWNHLSWLALLLTLGAFVAVEMACVLPGGNRGTMLAGGLGAAGALVLFALVDGQAINQLAINGLPYVYGDALGWRLGLYIALALSAVAAPAVAALWHSRGLIDRGRGL